jgi:hypothetical protein
MTRHPILIVEGPDAVGKTTWSREFIRQTGARYLHLPLRRKMYEHQAMSLALAVKWSATTPVLIDRHWPSEQLYGAAYRGGSKLDREADLLDRVMVKLGVTYLVCLLSTPERMFEAFRKSHQERHEMYEPDEKYRDLVHCYFDWWHGTNYTQSNLGHCGILRGFEARRPLTAHLYNYEIFGRTQQDFEKHVKDVAGFARDAVESTNHDVGCQDVFHSRQNLLQELKLP